MKKTTKLLASLLFATTLLTGLNTMANADAYLEITLKIAPENRAAAADIYAKYKQPFLTTINGATSKSLLVREEDVQVLHGFTTTAAATAYLSSPLFTHDVVTALKPLLITDPEVRIYEAP